MAKQYGWCHHPSTGYIEGVETFGEQVNAVLKFEPCWERTDADKPVCLDRDELIDWSITNEPRVVYVSTFTWVDLSEITDYFKQTMRQETITSVTYL